MSPRDAGRIVADFIALLAGLAFMWMYLVLVLA